MIWRRLPPAHWRSPVAWRAGSDSRLTAVSPYLYDYFLMLLASRRIFAVVTAVAVLVMSIDCACAGGMTSMRQAGQAAGEQNAEVMPCCAHHGGAAHHCNHPSAGAHKHQPNPCNGACEHCGQTVMNDTVVAPSHGASFFLCAVGPILAIEPATFCASDFDLHRPSLTSADLPPPVTAPTLLSLHCALTI